MQEKVNRDDHGKLRHAVKRCKTSQVMEEGFALEGLG